MSPLSTFLAAWPATLFNAAVLAVFVTIIAYIHNTRLKLWVFSMPVPFTCAFLASGRAIDATNLTGLTLSVVYHWIVFAAVRRLRLPLPVGMAIGVTAYIAAAVALRPMDRVPFPWVAATVAAAWVPAVWLYRPDHEPAHRATSPWFVKLPVVFAIAIVIFSLTGLLKGAVTTFPYAGTFASYEMRRSLKTLAGQYTINVAAFLLMFVAMWATQAIWFGHWGRPDFAAGQTMPQSLQLLMLAAGWATLLTSLAGVYRLGMGKPRDPVPVEE